MLIPNGPLPLLDLRVGMLVAWIDAGGDFTSQLARWHDLQHRLTTGFRLAGFSEGDVRRALMIDPIDD
jgi:hypothetical protein